MRARVSERLARYGLGIEPNNTTARPTKSPQGFPGLGLMCCIPLENSLRANLTNRNANITQPQIAVSDGDHGVWVKGFPIGMATRLPRK